MFAKILVVIYWEVSIVSVGGRLLNCDLHRQVWNGFVDTAPGRRKGP